ncbi:hypothetical protein [Tahibacter harae]|uniref:Uncharacterized protein n=1 Tax=Tahibacter harae TaxID=2963937 RepID=A0ABT1QS62_9GAMM|nr:hypothetical protein [Tahibacter harae]MCQ4165114.1 hypothetical protein [Tahibacter harae]
MLDQVALKSLAIELASAMPPAPAREEQDFPRLDQSPRARALRRISEIVKTRGWEAAVTRALDQHGATCVADLSDEAVYQLRDRVERYEDCAETCCDPDDALPAR